MRYANLPDRSRNRLLANLVAALASACAVVTFGASGAVANNGASNSGIAILATQNMDEGSDFGPVLGAVSQTEFLSAVHSTWLEVQASNIPERAAAVAGEIAVLHPDLIGLQEVSQWRTGPLFSPPTSLRFDALQSLLDALAQRGAHYAAIATITEGQFEAPDVYAGIEVAVTDLDVILARTDLGDVLSTSNVQTQHFSTLLSLTTPFGNSITVNRGWASVDVTLRGRAFRFITTHLEAFVPAIQVAQAAELVNGPANTALPVVLGGDLNSAAAGGPDSSASYNNIITAGFADVWNATNPGRSGFTWPLHLEDPYTPTATPSERIDLLLTKGVWNPIVSWRFGNLPIFRTSSGLWPSDHAGVACILARAS